jgi:germination protein YpeB
MDGVVVYPDGVQVKVCRTRGVVTGLDATKYALNHKVRAIPTAKISLEQAMEQLHDKLQVQSSRLAIVQTARGERLAYEFVCEYEEERYVVYLDAQNGEEISILNLRNLG